MASDLDAELIADIGRFATDPVRFCRYAYPWGEGDLTGSDGPRQWQDNINRTIRDHLSEPSTRFKPLRIAVASGHGIGKTGEIGMLLNWAMSTCEDCRIVVTANTDTQLRTKTWPEVSKWFRMAINADWWTFEAESITVRELAHKRSWRADRVTWSENNTEAFAGLHNQGKRIVVVYDEASAIPGKIWEVTEGALTDENTEIIWLAFGNATQNTGSFKECFGRQRHRWKTFQIDSRDVDGTNKELLQSWVDDYGEDSDFVRVRVRGEFPRSGSSQFIGADLVAEARQRTASGYERIRKIMAVDVARFGDDQSVIGIRQGPKFRILDKLRGLDTVQVAARVDKRIAEECPATVVVDGDGIGGGVIDQLRHLGHGRLVKEFHGGTTPNDTDMYFNRRAEVWGLTREWLKAGGDLPNDPEMETDLTGVEYHFSGKNQIQLERKEDMKSRGLASPDSGDCLAMSLSVSQPQIPQSELDQERVQSIAEAHGPTAANMERMRLDAIRARKKQWTRSY